MPVEFLEPERVLMHAFEIEAVRGEHAGEIDMASAGLDAVSVRVEGADDLAGRRDLFGRGGVDLVENHHIGELDLLHKEIDEGALVAIARRLAAIAQEIGGGVVLQQAHRVHHRDHRVQPGKIAQAPPFLVAELDSRGDGERVPRCRWIRSAGIDEAATGDVVLLKGKHAPGWRKEGAVLHRSPPLSACPEGERTRPPTPAACRRKRRS
ncbi:hypothetical protein Amme_005_006 [Acidomonas methanolica NBRC 104435]|uniref:Uncharacterized protein n=1 Tax=Acidomonas methanolica NBRC 104435 TaxID=1231351 RepID=A0A023D0C0_ACIMT|nr:uncharacterized protein DUF1826 [Acidomonas methanolica]GAJ27618.1 hypothetical protein Amme_005_006 [Acidomonas methanolica NBRC 104435]GEK97680.1 hypothetical protein AME01nite_01790 [Acidomonas methanolica NBRC 104435]